VELVTRKMTSVSRFRPPAGSGLPLPRPDRRDILGTLLTESVEPAVVIQSSFTRTYIVLYLRVRHHQTMIIITRH
jgi:hypothetical protein